jgi:hypothetical protein
MELEELGEPEWFADEDDPRRPEDDPTWVDAYEF